MRLNLMQPPREDPLHEARAVVRWLLVGALLWAGVILLAAKGCEASSFRTAAEKALADPATSEVKRDLFRQALAHADELEVFTARTYAYTPKEAGPAWRRWMLTCLGTLVQPGTASCTQANRGRWLTAWVWFEGVGLHKVLDTFPESRDPHAFDLAAPEAYPGQSYEAWLADPSRVRFARTWNRRVTAVCVKPRGGWEQ